MAKVLVIYCSMTGNTQMAAEAVAEGARSAGAEVSLMTGTDAQPDDLIKADAVALGSYDAFSYMGGPLKDFFDRALYPTQDAVTDKPYVAFLTHGGGGKAMSSIESLAKALKLRKAADSVSVVGRPEAAALTKLQHLGAALVKAI